MHYISGPKGGKILADNGYHYRYGYKTTQHQVFYCKNRSLSSKNKKKCTVQLKIIDEVVEVINSHNHEPVEEVITPNNNDKNTNDNIDSSMPTKIVKRTSESLNNSNERNHRIITEQTAYVLRTRKVMAMRNSIVSIPKIKNTNYHRNRSPNKISLIEANSDILEKLNTSLKTDINENDQNQIQNEQSKKLEGHDFNVDLMDIDNVSLKMENVVKLSETVDTIPDLIDDKNDEKFERYSDVSCSFTCDSWPSMSFSFTPIPTTDDEAEDEQEAKEVNQ